MRPCYHPCDLKISSKYAIAFGVVAVCALLIQFTIYTGWYPFFYDGGGLYGEGIIDGSDWRDNRFRLL